MRGFYLISTTQLSAKIGRTSGQNEGDEDPFRVLPAYDVEPEAPATLDQLDGPGFSRKEPVLESLPGRRAVGLQRVGLASKRGHGHRRSRRHVRRRQSPLAAVHVHLHRSTRSWFHFSPTIDSLLLKHTQALTKTLRNALGRYHGRLSYFAVAPRSGLGFLLQTFSSALVRLSSKKRQGPSFRRVIYFGSTGRMRLLFFCSIVITFLGVKDFESSRLKSLNHSLQSLTFYRLCIGSCRVLRSRWTETSSSFSLAQSESFESAFGCGNVKKKKRGRDSNSRPFLFASSSSSTFLLIKLLLLLLTATMSFEASQVVAVVVGAAADLLDLMDKSPVTFPLSYGGSDLGSSNTAAPDAPADAISSEPLKCRCLYEYALKRPRNNFERY